MIAWYIGWPIFSVIAVLTVDRLFYGDWYWQFEFNLWRLWRNR